MYVTKVHLPSAQDAALPSADRHHQEATPPVAPPPPLPVPTTAHEIEQQFAASRTVQRQMAAFNAECQCTQRLMARQAALHASLERVLVLDGSAFRWEGLGNSGVRWLGLLRFGFALERATFLRISRDEDCKAGAPSDRTCHLDPGSYFTGYGGVDWHWGTQEADTRRRLQERGVHEEVYTISGKCVTPAPGLPGCSVSSIRLANGS
eukprot:CAMPEP_0185461828 /NCGR_PEP_ID=MMETSP1365-20130426/90927_1 /TAXON_ID=38817 /ORGANISM="Gephyrocapsa oceanica, Strain RCC1303" /LENGTH=206 /DNA_ID=CAMNT_0028068499 /DNA_START=1 /DNA_END=618 /DNA_ORIENTATION=+